MRLSLIGMAATGKSYWSMQLAEHGFQRFCCDDLIAAKLAGELTRPDGSVMDMGQWMGFPYQPKYRERESRYLALEIEVLTDILSSFERDEAATRANVVVDTTGSVVYTGEAILTKLRHLTAVVHLATPPEVQEQMLNDYVAKPGPVLWRNMFKRKPKETNEEALTRCYANLLSSREKLYGQYADITIDYYRRRKPSFSVSDFLRSVEEGMPKPLR